MSSGTLHPANEAEAARVWPAVAAAHLFDSRARFERFHAEAPWRVHVTDQGEAVVFERWRAHLEVLALKGLWAAPGRVPAVVRAAARVAAGQGFSTLLSPLVAEEAASAYRAAGMADHAAVVVLRYDRHASPPLDASPPAGTVLRRALPADLASVARIDAACFDAFWRYDPDRLAGYLVEDRLMVAEEDGQVIGYTLSTLVRESATIGRLAVDPAARRRGIGKALLADALSYLARTGAGSVSLCTQEENRASRELYRSVGLRELQGRLLFLTCPTGAGARE